MEYGVWSMEYGVISLCRNQLPAVSHVPEDWILRNEVRAECFGPLFRALLLLCCIDIIDITDITDIVLSLKSVDASRSSYRQDAVVNLVGCFAESQLEQASNDPRNLEQDLAESRRPPWHTISIHQWKWSARCAWSTMGNPMLPTLLLCAIHESSSLLRRTNVYFKCDTPDRSW